MDAETGSTSMGFLNLVINYKKFNIKLITSLVVKIYASNKYAELIVQSNMKRSILNILIESIY